MEASGLTKTSSERSKEQICQKCINSGQFEGKILESKTYWLGDFIDEQDKSRIKEIVRGVTRTTWSSLVVDETEIGRLAAYEILIRYKMITETLTDEAWIEYRNYLNNTLIAHFASKKFFEKNHFDSSVVYNHLYGINRAFFENSKRSGVKAYSIQAGGPLNDLYSGTAVYQSTEELLDFNLSKGWDLARQKLLTSTQVSSVLATLESNLTGKSAWNYSSPVNKVDGLEFLDRLGSLAKERKLILLTLSSSDELFSAHFVKAISDRTGKTLKISQFEIVQNLIEKFRYMQDYVLIIRPHPREFPNKREGQTAEQVVKWNELFEVLPDNVVINFPGDDISVYKLGSYVDLTLNISSTVGLDFSLLGFPTLLLDEKMLDAYPAELNEVVMASEDLEDAISRCLSEYQKEWRQVLGFRWMIYKHSSSLVSSGARPKLLGVDLIVFFRVLASRSPGMIQLIPLGAIKFLNYLSRIAPLHNLEVVGTVKNDVIVTSPNKPSGLLSTSEAAIPLEIARISERFSL
jgi:hypothetical protein